MKNKILTIMSVLILLGLFSSCSNSDENDSVLDGKTIEGDGKENADPNSIIGVWELESVWYPFYIEKEIPTEKRDLYYFYSNDKVKVLRKAKESLYFLDEGIYNYSYDSSKQEIFIKENLRSCTISDGVMTISGDFFAYKESITSFVFIKKVM